MKYTLNNKQQQTFDQISEFGFNGTVNEVPRNFVVLKGYAGTGKTFTVNLIAKELSSKTVCLTAPTHKAVKVMRKNAIKNGTDNLFMFATIHSLLGLTPKIQKNGSRKYVRDSKRAIKTLKIHEVDVLFIDEASMINVSLLDQLFAYYKEFRKNKKPLRFIFLGDPCQIPPVNELHSIVFNKDFLAKHNVAELELDEIVRQAEGNTILDFATDIRQNLKVNNYPRYINIPDYMEVDKGVCRLDPMAVEFQLRALFTDSAYDEDPDLAKVLCWRNKTVKYYNDKIRAMRLGIFNPPKLVIGDLLVADDPVIIDTVSGPSIVYHTSDELTVLELDVKSIDFAYDKYSKNTGGNIVPTPTTETLQIYVAKVASKLVSGNLEIREIQIIHENSELLFNTIKKDLIDGAKLTGWGRLWGNYYRFNERFAKVSYNYAITCHKSQGSTYKEAIMVDTDILENPNIEERNRIRYVAATRASDKLYVI